MGKNRKTKGWKAFAELALTVDESHLWMKGINDFFRAHIGFHPQRVLELGCTTGRWLRWFLEEYGSDVYGVDLEKTGLEKMGIGNPVLGDASRLPFKSDSFDVVYSIGLIEHFTNPRPVLSEAMRVLKSNRRLS